MKRGEIWWANLPEPLGRRPVLLISRNVAYDLRANVTIIPLTRTVRRYATEILISKHHGIPQKSVINADNIFTIPKTLLIKPMSMLPTDIMREVERSIIFALELEMTIE